ncbi:hypothetical protein T261_7639 [Streptomyces lydicus]|nr:hypothetical protein T261_7639 [Streptomyces lydicus]
MRLQEPGPLTERAEPDEGRGFVRLLHEVSSVLVYYLSPWLNREFDVH